MDPHKKIDYIRYTVELKHSLTIPCITETNLGKCIADNEVALPHYSLWRRDRDRRGSGVAIYCRSEVAAEVVQNISEVHFEHCTLQIMLRHGKCFNLCCIYQPKSGGPSSQWLKQFHILVDNLYNQNIPVIFLGHLNINLLKRSVICR